MKYYGRFVYALIGICLLLSACATWADDANDLNLAVSRDESHGLSKLLEKGVDPNLKEPQRGETPLMIAVREKAMRSLEVLLDNPKTNIEASANNGDTALMIASFTQNTAAVKALLAHDAEVNRHGWAPLHYAAAVGGTEIVKLLLDKSAYVDAESPNKTTPLMMAARGGQTDAARALIDGGADVSLKNDQGLSALDFALKNEHRDTAELIKSALKPAASN